MTKTARLISAGGSFSQGEANASPFFAIHISQCPKVQGDRKALVASADAKPLLPYNCRGSLRRFPKAPKHHPWQWQIRAMWRRSAKRSNTSGCEEVRLLSRPDRPESPLVASADAKPLLSSHYRGSPEGFQRATGKPFGRVRRREIPLPRL